MREALHIFLKDSRHLRYSIALVLAWTAFFVMAGGVSIDSAYPMDVLGFLVSYISRNILPVSWAFLIVRAFHADAIPGDRQFWVTRPYSRASLFGAKALFVLAYITVPFAIAQMSVVVFRGFPLGPSIPGMLWSQVLVLAVIALPSAALASVTSKLTQFVAVALAAPVLGITYIEAAASWGPFAWVWASIAIGISVAVTGTVLFLQFGYRRTSASRAIALAGIAAIVVSIVLTPWEAAFALQSRVANESNRQLTAQLVAQTGGEPPGGRSGRLSFGFAGLSAETLIKCEATETTIQGPDGSWETGLQVRGAAAVSTIADGCTAVLSQTVVTQAGTRPVNVHAEIYITVFGPEQSTSVPIDRSPTIIPNAALCSGTTSRELISVASRTVENSWTYAHCVSAFRDPRRLIQVSARAGSEVRAGRLSYSPFPADLRIPPLESAAYFTVRPTEAVTIEARDPIAHVRVAVDARDVNLQDYLR